MKKEHTHNKVGTRLWFVFIILGLTGQIAWALENMYLNTFIFYLTPSEYQTFVPITVAVSAIMAALASLIMGGVSDKIGKRKIIISVGYILWGISTALFGFVADGYLNGWFGTVITGASTAAILTIVIDSVMTFFGSSSNDAAFNSYLTRNVSKENRGKVEAIMSIMPVVAMLLLFVVLDPLTKNGQWNIFFYIIGAIVTVVGIISIFLIPKEEVSKSNEPYFKLLIEGFKPSVIKQNKELYIIYLIYFIYGVASQVFFPYLMIYINFSLNLANDMALVLGVILVIASILTVIYGRICDKIGKFNALIPSLVILIAGLAGIFFVKPNDILGTIFAGTFMILGYLIVGTIISALSRDYIPKNKEGVFLGVRMICFVALPMVIGPYIGTAVIDGFSSWYYKDILGVSNSIISTELGNSFTLLPHQYLDSLYLDQFKTWIDAGDLVAAQSLIATKPNPFIYIFSILILLLSFVPIYFLNRMNKKNKFKENKGILLKEKVNEEELKVKEVPLNEYPRMNLRRDSYFSLNGKWDCKIENINTLETIFEGQILVPYAIESPLSGVNHLLNIDEKIIYTKTLDLTNFNKDKKVILHFEGVDQTTKIFVDGEYLLTFVGGYNKFEVELTKYIGKVIELKVEVTDLTDSSYLSRGKQCLNRGNIWYTSTSGIYKPVWLEEVPLNYIKNIKFTPLFDTDELEIFVEASTDDVVSLEIDSKKYEIKTNEKQIIKLENIKYWNLENPYLYDVKLNYLDDKIESYFGYRKIEIKQHNGVLQPFLNNCRVLLNGLLDQGYYYLGNLTPRSYDDYYKEISELKELKFNTLRKHIKTECDYFYYLCDKLGMLVIQDFISGGRQYKFRVVNLPSVLPKLATLDDTKNFKAFAREDAEGRNMYLEESKNIINELYNHPSVICYTVFNEGWGQFETVNCLNYFKQIDSTRLYDANSGWHDMKVGDFKSDHTYFSKIKFNNDNSNRAYLVSEFGGLSFKNMEHYFGKGLYQFHVYKNLDKLNKKYESIYLNEVVPAIREGLSGLIYTQVSDVEDEVNGLYTFDRKVFKLKKEMVKNINQTLYDEFNKF